MVNTRYEIIKKLGQGRSSVYLCRDIEFPEKEYAIKILPPVKDKHEREIFIKEYFTLQKLEHPGIIEAFELGTVYHIDGENGIETGSDYITMEYFEGEELLSSKNIHNEKNLKEIVRQISSVLYYLHQSKYIYYDLKPENILVSFKDENPQIRLIDLGLAEYSPSPSDYEVKGTAYYIAPELLKKENHNHSVDFYSLGIILYQIIYGRFPIDAKNEMDIYKSTIEYRFEFPSSDNYSQEFINIVKKLLEKEVVNRYESALAIIKDLGFLLDISTTKEFLPAKVYSCRDDLIKLLSEYFADNSSSAVYVIKGFDGVGKSSLLLKLQEFYADAVVISGVKGKSAEELIRYMLRKIFFSKPVFTNLTEQEKLTLLKLLTKSETDLINEFRTAVALLTSRSKFIILIDDFNLYDPLASDLLVEIIPLLQVNNIKVVLAESSGHNFLSSRIKNAKDITLVPFTKEEMINFLDESYISDFAKEDLKSLIIANADLIPGNIKSFIKDLILFGIMKFSDSRVFLTDDEKLLLTVTEAHYSIYDLRIANLSDRELNAAKIISALDIYIDSNHLSSLLGLSLEETEKMILNLQLNNIFQRFTTGHTLVFTSDALKKYIYSSIENKKDLHLQIAKELTEKSLSLNRLEAARHYELGEEFETSFNITLDEINDTEKHSAYSYMQRLLTHLLQLPLENKLLASLKIRLSEVYLKLGDVQASLKTIKELKSAIPPEKFDDRLFIIEGSALIAAGEYQSGKKVLAELLKKIGDEEEQRRLKIELAYADFELKRYDEANEQCKLLLSGKNLSPELTGRCYNLKGMIDIYQKNDMSSALENFQNAKSKFEEAGQPARVAGAEVNIGNIYNILAKHEKAELHWKSASKINQSIGNLDQEGLLMQNIGAFYFTRNNFESAIKSYQRAHNIFVSLGNELSRGIVLWDLGEIYISSCEYENALNSLTEAESIFIKMHNYSELLDDLFMKGKLFYRIGEFQQLEQVIDNFHIIMTKYNLNKSHEFFEKLLIQFNSAGSKQSFSITELESIREEMIQRKDSQNYIEVISLIIHYYINKKLFQKTLTELYDQELIDLCSQNSILEAEREYFLGLISKNFTSDSLLPPLVYFEKAYELIKDENVSELTWKVLLEIAEIHIERGNLNKAKHFITYARELIYLIAERIESPQLRAAYLRQKDRFNTLKKLESFYPQK